MSGCDRSGHGNGAYQGATAASQAPAAEATLRAQAPDAESKRQPDQDGLPVIAAGQLPRQAVATLRLIEAGGPFPYGKDGVVFGNRERLLPPHPRGFYHEYTVPTPRARDRGARRIVCGGPKRQIDNCYYSDDHYASFKRIADQLRD